MTDIRTLLDHAAGDEPPLTLATLAADLMRGQRVARRRRVAAVGSAAGATALVVALVWAALPGPSLSTEPGVAGTPSPAVSIVESKAEMVRAEQFADPLAPPPYFVEMPVQAGEFRCRLRPRAWGVVTHAEYPPATRDNNVMSLVDQRTGRSDVTVIDARLVNGLLPQYDVAWAALQKHRLGRHEAVVMGSQKPAGWSGDVFVRTDQNRFFRVAVTANAHWVLTTVLQFAGSCDYAR
jgi:hypothetical protein